MDALASLRSKRRSGGSFGFSTFSSGGTAPKRRSARGLFEDAAPVEPADGRAEVVSPPVSAARDEAEYNVSVGERKLAGEGKHARDSYTIYVSTPSNSLTLARTVSQIAELDAKLRTETTVPPELDLPPLATSLPPPRKRTVLQQISRTISPPKRTAGPKRSLDLAVSPLTQLGAYLTALAREPTIRSAPAWTDFLAVGPDDLQSRRTVRMVKRVRSDLASHASPSPVTVVEPADEPAEVIAPEPAPEQAQSSPLPSPADSPTVASSRMSRGQGSRASSSRPARKTAVTDFDIVRVLGKGCAGKVLLVRHKTNRQLYAMKAIHKHHVLAHRELQHTLTEQSVLKAVALTNSNAFVVRLWWSFHDVQTLYLVMDFHPGGDLATQLARWGRLGRDRARFYAVEITEGLIHLHKAGVIYRDLKPENILIGADGHAVLTDFGLSKQFDRAEPTDTFSTSLVDGSDTAPISGLPVESHQRPQLSKALSAPAGGLWAADQRETTTTFCGTAEYLAPEVLLGERYSYEVDWWSLGTLLYEMLTGVTPFWSEDHSTMYRRVLHDELSFDVHDATGKSPLDQDTKSLLRGLLQKSPALRMSDARIRKHAYFSMISWSYVSSKRYIPPYVPKTDPHDETDTQNFDEAFVGMTPAIEDSPDDAQPILRGGGGLEETGDPQAAFDEHGRDVFDGYSYRRADADNRSLSLHDEGDEDELVGETAPAGSSSDDGITSSSAMSVGSSRPTTAEPDLLGSPAALKDHGRQRSTGLDSLVESVEGSHGGVGSIMDEDEVGAPVVADVQEDATEAEEDDWDVVEGADELDHATNGRQTQTLFSRGVVDRYRMQITSIVSTAASSSKPSTPTVRPSSKVRRRSSIRLGFGRNGDTSSRSSSTDGQATPPLHASLSNGTGDRVGRRPLFGTRSQSATPLPTLTRASSSGGIETSPSSTSLLSPPRKFRLRRRPGSAEAVNDDQRPESALSDRTVSPVGPLGGGDDGRTGTKKRVQRIAANVFAKS